MATPLPIETALPELLAALKSKGRAVLQAPPGAGKTTRVPLALLSAGLVTGKILMLEPRRLAARASAERMAQTLGEKPGETVGYRMRGASVTSKSTRIEVVTEGILTRMLQSDPDLPGIGAVIFDEFHERSLNADLGLALAWEVRQALRPDLMLLVMSATLDAAPVAALLDDAPIVTSAGRSYPVEARWRERPPPDGQRFEAQVAALILRALDEVPDGGCLAFLPGEGEIRRVLSALDGAVAKDVTVLPLFGALPFAAQQAAIRPAKSGRKVVLATSIAETSLTLEDIRIVVDGGRSRRARFDPSSGMSRLVTERVTKAEATQRMGRAGRVAPGVCYRNWTRGEEGGMAPFPPAEIEAADLSALALELAAWGDANGSDLAFLTPPPPGTLAEAQALLQGLEALDDHARITPHGHALAALPLHPRLAHMVLRGGAGAAQMAALLSERDPLRDGGVDLLARLSALKTGRGDPGTVARIKTETKRLSRFEDGPNLSPAQQAALAYPDRIGLRRDGDAPRWLLSGGKGAAMATGDVLSGARLIVACDLDGDRREAKVRRALALSEAELRSIFGPQITWHDRCTWDSRTRRVLAQQEERFGALALTTRRWADAPQDAIQAALIDGIRALGLGCLNWSAKAKRLRARIAQAGVRDMSDDPLLNALEDWAAPYLGTRNSADDLRSFDPTEALQAWIGWDGQQTMDRLAPGHYTTPLGRKVPIDYSGDAPTVELRLQEVFGETTHPYTGPNRTPLRMVLLSPGHKPVQVTQDLPGFWATSYADVRKDMRGRYPRHPWPEDPTQADPTVRAKPRGT